MGLLVSDARMMGSRFCPTSFPDPVIRCILRLPGAPVCGARAGVRLLLAIDEITFIALTRAGEFSVPDAAE